MVPFAYDLFFVLNLKYSQTIDNDLLLGTIYWDKYNSNMHICTALIQQPQSHQDNSKKRWNVKLFTDAKLNIFFNYFFTFCFEDNTLEYVLPLLHIRNWEGIAYFLVVVRFPFMMRVEVETDLKLPIPPPMLSIPSRPPKVVEKEENSTVESQTIKERRGKQY